MRKILNFILVGIIFMIPIFSFAQEQCSKQGYTIATINGIFTNEKDARKNMVALWKKFDSSFNNQNIDYQYLLNESHLGGAGDILKSVEQGMFDNETIRDTDLLSIIQDASAKVKTQKLLLVAHSQGNFYANSFYDSVAGKNGGVPTESIGVYGVATPASRVAGGGKWLTSDTDKVVAGIVGHIPFKKIMASNTHIELKDGDDFLGHNFTDIYLKYKSREIIAGIQSSLDELKTDPNRREDALCIDPPKLTLINKVSQAVLTVGDLTINTGVSAVSNTVSFTYNSGKTIAGFIKKTAQKTKEAVVVAAQKTTAAIKNTAQDVKDAFSNTKKESPLAMTANIGQIATQTESGIKNQETRDSSVASLPQNNTLASVIPVETGVQSNIEIASESLSTATPRNDNNILKQVQDDKNQIRDDKNEIIHEPYQWPAEEVSSANNESVVSVVNSSGSITNQFQGQFNGSFVSDSSPAAQNDTGEVAQNDTGGEVQSDTGENVQNDSSGDIQNDDMSNPEAAPEAPQEQPQEQPQNPQQEEISSEAEQESSQSDPEPQPEEQPQPEPQPTIPDIQFYLSGYNVRQMNFTLNWQDANSVIKNWELQYKLAPEFDWEILRSAQNDGGGVNSYDFTAQYDDLMYYFRLRGQDASGNWTEWQALQADISTNPVVINEIAWMGTKASTNDEWIELANKTDQEIDLSGWILRESDSDPEIILTGKIAPNGFYLLERTSDNTIKNVTADQIYAGALNNPQNSNDYGKDLVLSDADGNIVDQTKTAYNGVSNFNSKMSSERVSIWADSNNSDNWKYYWGDYLTTPVDAKDAGNNTISGTPKSQNSWAGKYFSISSDIVKNTTLLKDRGTVKVLNNINITSNSILNIGRGTVLKFSGGQSGLTAQNGSQVIAKGTADNKIVFTSSNDNNYGIQTGYSSPRSGDWGKIDFAENSSGEFDNVLFRYAGGGTNTPTIKTYKANIKILNSYFENSKYDVIYAEYSDVDIFANTLQNNNGNGISILEGIANISGNTFNSLAFPSNGINIRSQKGDINITNNQFTAVYAPIYMAYFGNFNIQGNQVSGNSYNGIIIGASQSDYLYDEEVYLDSDMVYIIPSGVYYNGPKLKFAPGAIIKSASVLYVQGDLEAIGTADKPIIFTIIGDDSAGGNSEGSGISTPSYWGSINISNAANVSMDYFTIKYGGSGNYTCFDATSNIQNFIFANSTVDQCGKGLNISATNAQIENSTFSHGAFGMYLGISAQSGLISNTTFGDNLVEMISLDNTQSAQY